MSLDQKRTMISTVVGAGAVVLAIGMFLDSMLINWIGIFIVVGAIVADRIVRRCPHCGKYMKKLPMGATVCPLCGENIYE